MQFIAQVIVFCVLAYFMLSAIGFWWLLGAGIMLIIVKMAE